MSASDGRAREYTPVHIALLTVHAPMNDRRRARPTPQSASYCTTDDGCNESGRRRRLAACNDLKNTRTNLGDERGSLGRRGCLDRAESARQKWPSKTRGK